MSRNQMLVWLSLIGAISILSCSDQTSKSGKSRSLDSQAWVARGKSIQANAFATLSANLTSAMQQGGVKEAIKYCNLAAYPLTDSLSILHNAIIRRATLKPRNPKNRASETESAILQDYAKRKNPEAALSPMAMENQQSIEYFAPIIIQDQCLSCHGVPGKDIRQNDLDIIRKYYPKDKATGYKTGDLRGIWHITFKK